MDHDELLQPFEQRPVSAPLDEQIRKQDGLRLGWELNRLQGGAQSVVGRRLDALLVQGRVSEVEYVRLAAALARGGHLTGREP